MIPSKPSLDWVRQGEGAEGVERLEAFFGGHGYAPHRHDTYAVGYTVSGVQSFKYRRTQQHGLPGTVLVLHPDELHDGQAGTAEGFRYRMAYVSPWHIQQMLGGTSLPFIDGGVSRDPRLRAAIALLLQRLHARPDPLQHLDALHDLARSLVAAAGRPQTKTRPDFFAVARAREYMLDRLNQGVTLDDLASVAGTDRWQLSRDFRAVLGTSPYRFLTMRRLDRVRALLVKGAPIALAALEAGFYDQSHMARHFASVYGSPPARWLQRLGRGPHGR
ncbi:Uncharacterized HTH-type transcriptional regulator ybfI [Stenotrophomonas maltophilia SKK35]|uniref:AraC family transcriptional regulator n=1 Tax=Stenotrophomonas maltophilia TaxID=40324 RepID=A0AAJ2J947_STEMA|nr:MULTISPECIES: AraC family transcriptional regulator [Stenotrophomonas]CCP10709.1 Uncharacterized HTH-type transcriptional regulator ybfI [Stenotrophomonas maltophilia SKK35]MBH1365862.1 AraC family transcriptional regulator [Stenotrophomonas maltophilia]MDQ7281952.1 AraC family transcriptional regulator [Stenotrophomonas sp. Sm6012]MDT3467156.1 AraC family transcriptional regulator [Stenotrophomonas maltophilia]HEL3178858.1 AraC family transcriptional regulator [Stenotrophomonas maltophilia